MINYEFPPIGGGGGVFTYNLAHHLSSLGVRVDVLTGYHRLLPRNESEGENFQVFRTGPPRPHMTYARKIDMLSFILMGLHATFRGKDYDLVHSHFAVPSGILGIFYKTKMKVLHVISLLGSDVYNPLEYRKDIKILSPFLRLVYNSADGLTAPSKDIKERCLAKGCTKPISVIPHGVDLSECTTHRVEQVKGRVVCISRMMPRKALQYQIKAIPYVLNHEKNTEFIFIGDGPELPKLKILAKTLGVFNKVKFLGHVSRGKLVRLLASSELFAMHTLHEAFGIVFLEAMALGKPIVSTNVGAVPEVVTKDVGILVPPKTPDAFGEAIVQLLQNKEMRIEMSDACKKRVKDFSWSNIAKKYLLLYYRILGEEMP